MKRRIYSFLLILATVAYLGACSSSGSTDSSDDIGSSDSGSSDSSSDDTGSDSGSSDSGSDDAGSDSGSSESGGDDSGSSDAGAGGSTSAIAGLWDLPVDSALNFDIAEITPDGIWITWTEDTFDNCYDFQEGALISQGNNIYRLVISEEENLFLDYTFANQGDSLSFIFPTLRVDETWQALEGVNTSDFNLCG